MKRRGHHPPFAPCVGRADTRSTPKPAQYAWLSQMPVAYETATRDHNTRTLLEAMHRKGWVRWSGVTHFENGRELPCILAKLVLTDAGEIVCLRYQLREKKQTAKGLS